MSPLDCDVVVVGGGPAGAICAALLARRTFRVVLLDERKPVVPDFPETLSPDTVRVLQRLEISIDSIAEHSRPCRRIETAWASAHPKLVEVEWLRCRPGLTVDRNVLDGELRHAAQTSGVQLIAPARARNLLSTSTNGVRLSFVSHGERFEIRARFVVEACGRKAVYGDRHLERRAYFDRLTAVATHLLQPPPDRERLCVVAAENGWWYFAEGPRFGPAAVYLTDGDLLASNRSQREEQVRSELRAIGFPFEIERGHAIVSVAAIRDARTSCRRVLWRAGWMPIGDAAYTIDPLSGSGIGVAVRSASRSADAVAAFLETGDTQLLIDGAVEASRDFSEALEHRRQVYRPAAERFPNSAFWQRRLAVAVSTNSRPAVNSHRRL